MSSHITNGRGNGRAPKGLLPPAKGIAREAAAAESRDARGPIAVFKTRDGGETRGPILRLGRYAVAFEFCNPAVVLRTSEVLDKFKILIDGRMIYSGRAVVGGLIDAGAQSICEVKLDDLGAETDFFLQPSGAGLDGEQAYGRFFRQWQKNYRVSSEFKVQVTDIQAFLVATRQWLEQVEFDQGIGRPPPAGAKI